jgi:hypothetical protein
VASRSSAEIDLERIAVVYPGTRRCKLDDRVEAVPLASLAEPGFGFAMKIHT